MKSDIVWLRQRVRTQRATGTLAVRYAAGGISGMGAGNAASASKVHEMRDDFFLQNQAELGPGCGTR